MLSIGWTEMLLVAAVALIVVGPKDLPAMLRQIGKVVGSVRKMGNEFKAELNKVTAIDEIRDIKQSIAAPLTETRKQIEEEFNSIAPDGSIVPSGKIAPADPDGQSVVNEIRQGAGLEPLPATSSTSAAKASMAEAVTKAVEKNKQAANDIKAANDVGAGAATAKTATAKTATTKVAKKTAAKPAKKATRKTTSKTAKKPAAKRTKAGKKPTAVAQKPSAAKSPVAPKAASKSVKSEAG